MIPNRHPTLAGTLTLVLMLVLISSRTGSAQATGEAMIAPEIERVIAEEGIDAAKSRYQELSQSESLDVMLETLGLQNLFSTYQLGGKLGAAEAVAEMMSDMTMKMMSASMDMYMPPGMAEQMEAQQQAEQKAKAQRQQEQLAEQRLREEKLAKQRGQSRNDLTRFSGLFGVPGVNEPGRTIFVSVSCDGYLVTGPMWADISPWWMRSASGLVFTHSGPQNEFSMEFETGDGDKVVRMRHDIDGVTSPLEWKQDLPKEWRKCMERPY